MTIDDGENCMLGALVIDNKIIAGFVFMHQSRVNSFFIIRVWILVCLNDTG